MPKIQRVIIFVIANIIVSAAVISLAVILIRSGNTDTKTAWDVLKIFGGAFLILAIILTEILMFCEILPEQIKGDSES